MTTYRTGNHWGVTIVREPTDQPGCPENVEQGALSAQCRRGTDGICPLHGSFKPEPAQLVAVVVNGDQALAERICALLNGEPEPLPPAQCGCPVERRRARVESHTRECGQRAAAARIAADLAWIADSEGEL